MTDLTKFQEQIKLGSSHDIPKIVVNSATKVVALWRYVDHDEGTFTCDKKIASFPHIYYHCDN